MTPIPHHLAGVVINQLPIPGYGIHPITGLQGMFPLRFIGSPSITVMEDGTYLASHDIFKKGLWVEDGITTNKTYVFRSTDRGLSWQHVSTINNLSFATLFSNGRFAYLFGRSGQGQIMTKKSVNRGESWGAAHVIPSALDNPTHGMTPSPPVVHEGRLWFAQGGRAAMSVPLTESVLDPSAWDGTDRAEASPPSVSWTEGQVVASPRTGVVVMPKTRGLPYAGLVRIVSPMDATVDPDFPSAALPGAEKKFGCVYDAVSQRFFALTNPVLSVYADVAEPEMVRNTAAVFSSADLLNWRMEKIFLYSPDRSHEAFQYLNFVIDGDDLAVVSRTALAVGGRKPPRGHDSNIFSFHRIEGFRSLRREQVLVADTGNNRVLRFEANLTSRLAPVGRFSGGQMNRPVGVVQAENGNIYVSEQRGGGRVLRFNSTGGTFRGVVATEGVDFHGRPESLAFGPEGGLYLSTAFGSRTNKIYRIDTVTNAVTLFVPRTFNSNAGSGTLNEPRGIAFARDGKLYVADRANDRIRIFDGASGEFLGNLTTDQRRPQALAWDPDQQRLLFSRRTTDSDNDIGRVRLSGTVRLLHTKTDMGLALGIQSIGGRVYWTDHDENKIYMVTSEARREATTSATGLSHPTNMARVISRPTGL